MIISACGMEVARASRPLSRERPAPAARGVATMAMTARGQDAHATAGETPALRLRDRQ